jgi:hypothetical protein
MGFGHWEIFTGRPCRPWAPRCGRLGIAKGWQSPKIGIMVYIICLGYFGKCLEPLNEFGFYFPALNALNLESLVFSTYCLIWIEIQQINILPRASACSRLTFQCKPFIQPSASQPRSQIPRWWAWSATCESQEISLLGNYVCQCRSSGVLYMAVSSFSVHRADQAVFWDVFGIASWTMRQRQGKIVEAL